jgi:hypothetical protein
MPMQPESDLIFNRKDIEKFLVFPTVIHTPWYNKWSKSYEFLNISQNAFLTTEALSSQKTYNTKLVVNFLNFLVIAHMLKSDKQWRSYDH